MLINKTILAICFLLLPILAFAVSPFVELNQLLANLKSMRADFEQFVINKTDNIKAGQHTYGTMALTKPGKFRWQTKGETKQLIIANGDYVWIYDADLAQAVKRKIDYRDPSNPAMLLSGSKQAIQKVFYVTKLKMPGVGQWFELRPKTRNGSYTWLRLHFVEGKLVAMYMTDNLGQHSEIKFENVKVNIKLSPSLFTFTPPKGVDVVDETIPKSRH